jgi:Tfp pilus assembly protein PilX
MTTRQILRDERGVALPMAMIVLVLLTTLMVAFALLARTEPVIAHNQQRTSQALAHAEAGFERAVWALSQGVIAPGTGASQIRFRFRRRLPTTARRSSRMASRAGTW